MNPSASANKYLPTPSPKLAKTDMKRVETILNLSVQMVANLSIAFEPFLPFSCEKLRKMIALEEVRCEDLGSFDLLEAGHKLCKPELLFEKIEDDAIEAQIQKLFKQKKEAAENGAESQPANPIKPDIEFPEFEKMDLRIGTVLECTKVPKADKLLQFRIDDGLGCRTIVSGIADWYKPEDLVGKQVCFIANLAPRKIRGIESQGMILSASDATDDSYAVITVQRAVKPGSEVC